LLAFLQIRGVEWVAGVAICPKGSAAATMINDKKVQNPADCDEVCLTNEVLLRDRHCADRCS
jgi:hypothetical protein